MYCVAARSAGSRRFAPSASGRISGEPVRFSEMSNLWPRIEPLLARVEKPARYIGMERGSLRPEHRPRPGRLAAAVPRRLRDRPPQPGAPDPLRDPQRTRRRGRRTRLRALDRPRGRAAGERGAAVLGRHPPGGRRLRRPGLQPLGRARLHERAVAASTSPGSRCGQRSARPEHPLVVAGGHCTFNPEPLADFVDAFVIGDGEEPVGEITEVLRGVEACRSPDPRGRAARARHDPRRLRPGDVRRRVRRAAHRGGHAEASRRARRRRQAHGRRPRRLAVPEAASSCR